MHAHAHRTQPKPPLGCAHCQESSTIPQPFFFFKYLHSNLSYSNLQSAPKWLSHSTGKRCGRKASVLKYTSRVPTRSCAWSFQPSPTSIITKPSPGSPFLQLHLTRPHPSLFLSVEAQLSSWRPCLVKENNLTRVFFFFFKQSSWLPFIICFTYLFLPEAGILFVSATRASLKLWFLPHIYPMNE